MVYVERRDRSNRVIERNGPFERDSEQHQREIEHQMQIAMLHNRSRHPDADSWQTVWSESDDEAT